MIARRFRKMGISTKIDDSGSTIGKRYARNDELGTPLAITVDFQTVQDGTVTLRERDSTKQIRAKVNTYVNSTAILCFWTPIFVWTHQIDVIVQVVRDLIEDNTTWAEVSAIHTEVVQQSLN